MMTSNEKLEEGQQACSDPQPIPKEPSLRINNAEQCASFVSQRSSSIDTFGSDSPPRGGGGDYFSSKGDDEKTASLLGATSIDENSLAASERSVRGSGGGGGDAETKRWLCTTGAMPASMIHPHHRSTPVKDPAYLSTADGESEHEAEGEEGDANDNRPSNDEGDREIFLPGDLHTPITGYETMESRSKFTVYKIHVQRTALAEEDAEPSGWFIFRRYSDFLHLNERLKHMFPGFRLALPPKRWFRDNFDQNFLDDRLLGLQAFLTNITGHKDICNSEPVRAFFCTDEPPGPHDSLEESRALCDTLEESIYSLRQEVQDKDSELALLREEVALYKTQVDLLSKQLKAVTGKAPVLGKRDATTPTPTSQGSGSSNRSSLTDCDNLQPGAPLSDQAQSPSPEAQD